MAKIEGTFTQIDQRLGRVEVELVELRRHVNEELVRVHKEISFLRTEMIRLLIPMWVTIIGAIIGVALTR